MPQLPSGQGYAMHDASSRTVLASPRDWVQHGRCYYHPGNIEGRRNAIDSLQTNR